MLIGHSGIPFRGLLSYPLETVGCFFSVDSKYSGSEMYAEHLYLRIDLLIHFFVMISFGGFSVVCDALLF